MDDNALAKARRLSLNKVGLSACTGNNPRALARGLLSSNRRTNYNAFHFQGYTGADGCTVCSCTLSGMVCSSSRCVTQIPSYLSKSLISNLKNIPRGHLVPNDVVLTSMSIRRHFGTKCPLGCGITIIYGTKTTVCLNLGCTYAN